MTAKAARALGETKAPELPTLNHLWSRNLQDHWMPAEGMASVELPPALYELVVIPMMGSEPIVYLKPLKVSTDVILSLPGSLTEYIVQLIEEFWNSKTLYANMGVLHKRGVLLEGAPGTGKTAICLLTGQAIASRGGIAIFVKPSSYIRPLPDLLLRIRKHQPDTPLMTIMEDINNHRGEMGTLLSMLDGESQVTNIFHLATTNFIEKLDDRIINRPSRFDEVIKVKPPLKKTREAYFRHTLPADSAPALLSQLVDASNGLNFAHMKELAICSYVYRRDTTETAKRLKELAKNGKGPGFACDDPDDEEDD